MKPTLLIGIVLTLLAVIVLVYHGITYTTQEKILKIGPIEATREKEKTIPFPPVLGGVALAVGIVMIIVGARK